MKKCFLFHTSSIRHGALVDTGSIQLVFTFGIEEGLEFCVRSGQGRVSCDTQWVSGRYPLGIKGYKKSKHHQKVFRFFYTVQLPSAPGVPEIMGPRGWRVTSGKHLDLRPLHDIKINRFLLDFFNIFFSLSPLRYLECTHQIPAGYHSEKQA
jgi:hypothetical protein